VNIDKGQLQVRITKNGKARWVPFNQSLRGLLEALRAARNDEAPEKPIMRVFECQKSFD
jgi:integrase